MDYTNLTDDELVRRVRVMAGLSLLEVELLARLERALDEVQDLTKEQEHGYDARRAGQARSQAAAAGQRHLALL